MATSVSPCRRAPACFLFALAIPAFCAAQVQSGAPLFVSQQNYQVSNPGSTGVISSFDSVSGAAISNPLISNVVDPAGISLSGGLLYVAGYYHDISGQGAVGVFNESTGAAVNSSLITGLTGPNDILVTGKNLYVGTINGVYGGSSVAEYNASTGALNTNFAPITGLSAPYSLVTIGNNLFVANSYSGSGQTGYVGEYNATTGAVENASFITVYDPAGMAAVGTDLYVENPDGLVSEYDTSTGLALRSFSTAPLPGSPNYNSSPGVFSIAIANGNLYSADYSFGNISETNLTTGLVTNYAFESGLNEGVFSIGFDSTVPEPAPAGLVGIGLLILLARRRREAAPARPALVPLRHPNARR